jgi:uncharacterized membrane protein
MTFLYYLSLGYVAATLMISGIGHVLGFAHFRDLIRAHSIIPTRMATATAVLVIGFELVGAVTSLAVLLNEEIAVRALPLFAVCAIAGGAFAFYIRRLLGRPEGITSCGCSPFAGPLTPASIVPGLTLLLMSLLGLMASGLGYSGALGVTYGLLGISIALPLAWGVTLAVIVILLPASMPRPATNRRW